MKAIKITLALIAIAMLTISVVSSEDIVTNDEPTLKTHIDYDLIAHNKEKLRIKSRG